MSIEDVQELSIPRLISPPSTSLIFYLIVCGGCLTLQIGEVV